MSTRNEKKITNNMEILPHSIVPDRNHQESPIIINLSNSSKEDASTILITGENAKQTTNVGKNNFKK